MRVGLLGGSFDPIHEGHVAIASYAMEVLGLDAFYFIPTKNNPWKEGSHADGAHRAEMIRIATQDYANMNVETIELDDQSDEKNYTYMTLQKLTKLHPENKYYYLMGMDQAASFHEWRKPKKISKMVQLVAFNRGGYEPFCDNLTKYRFVKIENEAMTVSSTAIRAGHLEHLHPNVLRYISRHGLYLEDMIKERMGEKRYVHSKSVAQLTKAFAQANGEDGTKAWVAGIMHDVAKEMPWGQATSLMEKHYAKHMSMPKAIWHQWLGAYVCEHEFLIDDPDILKAITDHTTGSVDMTTLGKCLYCADKLDPERGYDSSAAIELCMKDIHEGFRQELVHFYEFSQSKEREIDPVFFEIYKKYVEGEC